MINNEILSFIKEQTAGGSTKAQVKDMLVTQGGWDEKDVDEAFETIGFSGTSYPSAVKNAMKSEDGAAKSGGAFAPASQLMQAVSGSAHPAVFSPGMSHMEQPKSMEPSAAPTISETMLRPKASAEAPMVSPLGAVAVAPSGFGGMGAGNPGFGADMKPAPVFQPVIKEPAVASSFPKPSGVAPATMYQPPVTQPAAPSFASGAVGGFAPTLAQPAPGGFSPFASLNKTPMSSPAPSPSVMSAPLQQTQQAPSTMGVFPKGSISSIGNPHGSPTPAQLAVLRSQKKGGRFLLGFMMFLVGIAVGGISMNAYMKGYINAEAASGLVENIMDKIGLGTPAPSNEAAPEAPAPTPPVDGGS